MANGPFDKLQNLETSLMDQLASIDQNISKNLIKFNIQREKLSQGIYSTQGDLQTLEKNFQTDVLWNQLNLQTQMGKLDNDFLKSSLQRGYNLDRAGIQQGFNVKLADLDKGIIDLETDKSLLGVNLEQDIIGLQLKQSGVERGHLQNILGSLDNISSLIQGQIPLVQELGRSQIGQSEITQEGLLNAQRGLSYRVSQSLALGEIQAQASGFSGGASNVLSSSVLLDTKVQAGVEFGKVLAQIDRNSLEQQQIATRTALRLNQIQQSAERVEINKENTKIRISRLQTLQKTLKLRQKFFKENADLIKELGESKKAAIDTRLDERTELYGLYKEFQKGLAKIQETSYLLGANFAQSSSVLNLQKLKANFENAERDYNRKLRGLQNAAQINANTAQQIHRFYNRQKQFIQTQGFLKLQEIKQKNRDLLSPAQQETTGDVLVG